MHDLFVIVGLKDPLVGEKQAAGKLVPTLSLGEAKEGTSILRRAQGAEAAGVCG
jgi:hypothetical protein